MDRHGSHELVCRAPCDDRLAQPRHSLPWRSIAPAADGRKRGEVGRARGHVTGRRQVDAGQRRRHQRRRAYESRSVGPRAEAATRVAERRHFLADLPAAEAGGRCKRRSRRRTNSSCPPHGGHDRIARGVTERGSVLPQRLLAVARFGVQPWPLSLPAQAARKAVTHAGIVKVFCEMHSHMSAVVRVFDTRGSRRRMIKGRLRSVTCRSANTPWWRGTSASANTRSRHDTRRARRREVRFTLPVLEAAK